MAICKICKIGGEGISSRPQHLYFNLKIADKSSLVILKSELEMICLQTPIY